MIKARDQEIIELIELLFFAYRDFVSEPDEILHELGFGRAHHRIIHFVGRNPGIRIAELLDILRITKQSLGRVLRELIETGYVLQREGARDRRQRLLYLTQKGEELRAELVRPQIVRIQQAIENAGDGSEKAYKSVLFSLINEDDRESVGDLIARRFENAVID
ncbi:MAG: MarR family winged helix-turn-helix transcriptional regulator [Hyphomicrobiales bacterium]